MITNRGIKISYGQSALSVSIVPEEIDVNTHCRITIHISLY
jgi:hypothetical protein